MEICLSEEQLKKRLTILGIKMRKKTVHEAKFKSRREYKFDTAMEQAAKKARACHPKLIGMVSNVKEEYRNRTS